MRLLRSTGNAVSIVFMLAALVLLLGMTAVPSLANYRSYVVLSGSMSPAIPTGAVVLAATVSPTTLKVGDVIVYNRSDVQERVTHRIYNIKEGGAHPTFTTKGDANGAPDTWTVQYPNDTAGKVVMSVPYVGYVYTILGSPQGRLVFLVVPVVVLSLMWLWQIWRPRTTVPHIEVEVPRSIAPAADASPARLTSPPSAPAAAAQATTKPPAIPLRQ